MWGGAKTCINPSIVTIFVYVTHTEQGCHLDLINTQQSATTAAMIAEHTEHQNK